MKQMVKHTNRNENYGVKLAISIVKIPTVQRMEEECKILKATTDYMEFFKKMDAKEHIFGDLHEKICERLHYLYLPKGKTVFYFGNESESQAKQEQ